jgi:integrase
MVPKDLIGKIEDSISGQSRDNTYYTLCKESEPPKVYGEELEDVRKKISEVAPEARPSLEKLLNKMEKLDYSLISRDIKSEYGPYICPLTQAFYYGILEGIDLAVHNNIYVYVLMHREHEQPVNIPKRIDNLKTALEYLASGDILERFFRAYLKKVDEEFYNETGYRVSELLRIKDIEALMNNIVTIAESLSILTYLSLEESERVTDIVENLVKYPEQYKKHFDEYIGYKAEK